MCSWSSMWTIFCRLSRLIEWEWEKIAAAFSKSKSKAVCDPSSELLSSGAGLSYSKCTSAAVFRFCRWLRLSKALLSRSLNEFQSLLVVWWNTRKGLRMAQKTTAFVGNLPFNVVERDLEDFFQGLPVSTVWLPLGEWGSALPKKCLCFFQVRSVRLIRDRESNKLRGIEIAACEVLTFR